MMKKIINSYSLVTTFNWGIAAVLIVLNVYLYPRLPQVVPVQFNFFGSDTHLRSKLIIWLFPLIFVLFAFLFNEKQLNRFISPPSTKNKWLKFGVLLLQLVCWFILLRAYTTYFLFI